MLGATEGSDTRNSAIGSEPTRSNWIAVSVAAALLHGLWFSPLLINGGVQNQDVAGIVYNARVLLNGGLPYLDTTEMKSPGAFFAVAPALALGGLRGMWLFAVFWATATSLATGLLVAACWGRRFATLAVLMHAAGAHTAGIGDANYGFWMSLPFTLTQVAVLRAPFRSHASWAAIGALSCTALAFKHNAIALAVPLGLAVARTAHGTSPRALLSALLSGAGGAGVVLIVLIVPYLLAGRTGDLVQALAAQLHYSSAYVGDASGHVGGPIALLMEGLVCTVRYAPGIFVVAGLGLVRIRAEPVARAAWIGVACVVGSSILALALTLRFFPHDLVMIWPAAVVLALTPGGVPDRVCGLVQRPSIRATVATALGLLVTAASLSEVLAIRRYLQMLDANIAELCRVYAPTLSEHDAVYAWGWSAWSTYEHCRRFAPGPHYKELGIVTTTNTNTCADPFGAPMRLLSGPNLEALERELRAKPPALIVVAPYYRMMRSPDPLDDFHAAQELLHTEYIPVAARPGYQVWRQREQQASR